MCEKYKIIAAPIEKGILTPAAWEQYVNFI